MAYQNPSYCFLHAAADAGVGSLTSIVAADTGYPLDNLIDYRQSSLFRFTNAGTDRWVKIDRGVGTLEAVDRLIIPAGHNLETTTNNIAYSSPDDSDWSNDLVTWDQSAASDPDGIINKTFTSTDDRYLRFNIKGAVALKAEYGQLVFTRTRTPTNRGIDPDWEARQVPALMRIPFPSRDASLAMAPNRWLYRVRYNRLDSTDLEVFDDLMTETGTGLVPFYFIPPDDGDDPILMTVQDYTARRQDRPSPSGASGASYRVEFSMLEQSG